MDESEFLDVVRQEAPLDSKDPARKLVGATLETLGERITDGEAEDLAVQLPDRLARPLLDAPGEAEPFPLEEYEARVSDRAGIEQSSAVEHVRAVATALSRAADEELHIAREQLPSEYDLLFEPGGPTTTEEFLAAVQKRADIGSHDAAEGAAIATLQTLGERLSAGEAEDLALYLPADLEGELLEPNDDHATEYSLEEFVGRVSQREGVSKDVARIHACAVGSVLAEMASEREVDAARKQLPDPMGVLFEPPHEADEA